MRTSVTLLEREGQSTALDFTSSLICAKRPNGAFALWLIETSDLGKLRHIVARQVRKPGEFVDAVLSLNEWTDLHLDYSTIVEEIGPRLGRLDRNFARMVNHVVRDRIAGAGHRAA